MKAIVFGLAFLVLVAAALAVPASEGTGNGKVQGSVNLDLMGDSSVKHNFSALLGGLREVLKGLGLDGALSGDHRGSGKLQAGLDFGASRRPAHEIENVRWG